MLNNEVLEDKIRNELIHSILSGFSAKEFTNCEEAEEWLENTVERTAIAINNMVKEGITNDN